MKKYGIKLAAAILILICIAAAGCGRTDSGSRKKIIVGSKSFTESNLLAEIYSLALEDAGYQVERKFNIAGSIIHQAITSNEIDLYPEYTGTALLSVLNGPVMTGEEEVYRYVSKEYEDKYNLRWLEPSPLNDGQGLVIWTETALHYGIKSLSDLQKNADKIRFASQGDFDEREDGLPALEAVYGPFLFASSTVYDDSLKYDVLKNGRADVAVAYTTEGVLDSSEFTLLEEDKKVWPPYHAAPVVRKEILEEYPDMEQVLNDISGKLTTEEIIKLNRRVDIDKEEMEETALDYYNSSIKDK